MSAITLTQDQQNALDAFNQFLVDPIETVFVIEGYSGTGKSTLVKTLIDLIPKFLKAAKLINPTVKMYDTHLTATTNKAAENFSHITGMEVKTIHSHLGLRVSTDFKTNTTTLVPSKMQPKDGQLLFIDEASYIDPALLSWIFKLTHNCKIVFIGDPAQLTAVMAKGAPVFNAGFKTARLSKVVRHDGPILELATKFRETVETGEFFKFQPDGHYIKHMDRDAFNQAVVDEFTRPDWRYSDSKLLAWTNKRVVEYNHFISDQAKGDPNFQVGDYAVCNKFITINKQSIKTDQLVCITGIRDAMEYGVPGKVFTLDSRINAFMPHSLEARKEALKKAQLNDDYRAMEEIGSRWIDLRAASACTINKSQGSTYDRVFIDLDDVARCTSGDQLARMLYVGSSRARNQVILTGDLV